MIMIVIIIIVILFLFLFFIFFLFFSFFFSYLFLLLLLLLFIFIIIITIIITILLISYLFLLLFSIITASGGMVCGVSCPLGCCWNPVTNLQKDILQGDMTAAVHLEYLWLVFQCMFNIFETIFIIFIYYCFILNMFQFLLFLTI